jgi:hypothetical protein
MGGPPAPRAGAREAAGRGREGRWRRLPEAARDERGDRAPASSGRGRLRAPPGPAPMRRLTSGGTPMRSDFMSMTACLPATAPLAVPPAALEPPSAPDRGEAALFEQLMQPQLAAQVDAGGDDDGEDDES